MNYKRYVAQAVAHPSGVGKTVYGIADRNPPKSNMVFRTHIREYTMHEAYQVAAWLNGEEARLYVQVPRHEDVNDPAVRFPHRKSVRRV